MISNADIYLAIAEEALAESQRLRALATSPMPDGLPGHVVAWDPQRKSFKQSLIAIAFAGVYLEAVLYAVGASRLGKSKYKKVEGTYEQKLKALGITDPAVLKECERFRKSRNDLVHEKAVEPQDFDTSSVRFAQHEAASGLALVKSLAAALQNVP